LAPLFGSRESARGGRAIDNTNRALFNVLG